MTRTYCWIVAALLLISGCGSGSKTSNDNPGLTGDSSTPVPTVVLSDEPVASPSEAEQPPLSLPLSVQNVRSIRYSATAGEVFWDAPADATSATRYRVMLDNVLIATITEHSLFVPLLREGVAHTASVVALDEQANHSQAVDVVFNDQIEEPPPVYEFELEVDRTRAALEEGHTDGTTFVITAAPEGRESITLAVQGEGPDDGRGLSVFIDDDTLDHEDLRTSVTFKMDIGMRPIMPQSRRFSVVATSGEEVRSTEIILDIKPVSVPDVYLLIGQSNMVGSSELGSKDVSPGGADERNDRVWQLNVSPNSSVIFSGADDFSDEANTAIEPRFIEAEDPLHDPRSPIVQFKGGTSVGPGMSFAKAALSDTTQRVYLVPAAWGASGFCNGIREPLAWNARFTDNEALGGTALLERALTRLRVTLRDTGGVFRGILWHQGGADSNSRACADSYAQNLQLMVERIRREAAHDPRGESARGSLAPIPFIVATQSRGRDERGDYSRWSDTKQQVDAVHRDISNVVPFADWVNNDDLVPPAYPCGTSSCVHFGALASRETGKRFYEALKRIWDRESGQ